jgi:hypothetical protein
MAAWFVMMAAIVGVVSGSVAASELGLGLFAVGYSGVVLLSEETSAIPSGRLSPPHRRILAHSIPLALALVAITLVLVAVRAAAAVPLATGIAAALSTVGPALRAVFA